jgi:hypothetical protein
MSSNINILASLTLDLAKIIAAHNKMSAVNGQKGYGSHFDRLH